eukprot:TRINITY_DN16179_c0_g1_i1.p1 TRINITY_DN16179_c0_g1~~TRINITY_DN16179_c0_g1_i1.p1  ORF type:complete len:207 (+),score=20.03 TRINITY_DN16179_c0_g1_i1:16-636(+)
MPSVKFLALLVLSLIALCQSEDADLSYVTCGSIVKLRHIPTNFRLHSHEVKYGSGSGQQSVTGFPDHDDTNSYWLIKAQDGHTCSQGQVVRNQDVIRLQHLNTRRLLHSHLIASPLSHTQEVSCYGDNGEGDQGDNWIVETKADLWGRKSPVKFRHQQTGSYLTADPNHKYGNPIPNQLEISARSSSSANSQWVTEEGVYFERTKE